MPAITLYKNQECTEIAGSGFVGEYRYIYGVTPFVRTSFGTHTVDDESVSFTQLCRYDRSTVKQFPEASMIPLTPTATAVKQYLYFTPRCRLCFYCYGSSHSYTFETYAYEMDFGSGFQTVTEVATETYANKYDILGIEFHTCNTAEFDDDTPVSGRLFMGIDLVSTNNQGQKQYDRCVTALSRYDVYLKNDEETQYKPATGNSRKGGTGSGYYPNSVLPALPTAAINDAFASVLGTGNGLTYYKLTGDCLSKITEFLYDCGLSLKYRNSQYRDAIASLIFIPYNVSADVTNTLQIIYLANKPVYPDSSCDYIKRPLREIDFGEVNLTAANIGFKSFADFIHTTATLYLPCFGAVNIDMSALANGRIILRGVIDVRNGNILYRVETQGADDETPVLYGQYNGNCGIPLPVGGANASPNILGAISSIGTVGVGIATGNPLNIIGGISGLAAQTAPDIDTSGAMQPQCAAFGTPVPVLQIKKRILLSPPKWGEINGIPSAGANDEAKYTVGSYTGFLQAAWCDVEGISGATAEEKEEIENLLKGGVFV